MSHLIWPICFDLQFFRLFILARRRAVLSTIETYSSPNDLKIYNPETLYLIKYIPAQACHNKVSWKFWETPRTQIQCLHFRSSYSPDRPTSLISHHIHVYFQEASQKIKLSTTPKMLAICLITTWELVVVGRTDAGRGGIHIGRNSFLLKVGAYSISTAWQKRNLHKTQGFANQLVSDEKKKKETNQKNRKEREGASYTTKTCFSSFVLLTPMLCVSSLFY